MSYTLLVFMQRRFGPYFALLLSQRELPAAEFARRVGCSKGWPSNISSGRQKPPSSVAELTRWGRLLGLNDTELDEFILLALLEHTPELVRNRFIVMYESGASKGRKKGDG